MRTYMPVVWETNKDFLQLNIANVFLVSLTLVANKTEKRRI
jgi:hypothetical protein